MAFKIKKEWIPDKFRTAASTPQKSENKSIPSVQGNVEIALDWGSGTTKILYRRSKDSAPHHFTLNQYRGPFEEDSHNLLPLTVAGRKGPLYYVPQSLSDQNTIRYFKVNLISKPTHHSYDYNYAVINIAAIVKAALEELAVKNGNSAITFYCGYPAKAEGNIQTLFSRIYKHAIELAQDPEFTPYTGVSAEFINKTRNVFPQMKIVMIPEISAESSFILKSNMLRNKWTFLIDVGSSTLDCSLMGRGFYNVYTLVDTEVYPFGIDNCVRQLAESTGLFEPQIKNSLFLSDMWISSTEYSAFRKILANKIVTAIKDFFTKSGTPKQFLIEFSSSGTGRPGPSQIDILYCIFGGGSKSPFFLSFLTTSMRKTIAMRDRNMNLHFVHTSTPENFLPPTIDKKHGGRFLVALGLFEDVSNIHVNRMGTVSPARK